jgi:hypothetical protein
MQLDCRSESILVHFVYGVLEALQWLIFMLQQRNMTTERI